MIRLLELLPDSLEVDGVEYAIHTDFRDWIAFEQMLFDSEISDRDKTVLMLSWYKEEPEHISDAVRRLIWFYRGGVPLPEGGGTRVGGGKIIYDFEQDAELIYSSFLYVYGMDLADLEYLHWWKFRALLLCIPEGNRLSTAMAYRASEDRDLTEHQRRIKRLYALDQKVGQMQRTLEDRDRDLLERARQARKRAESAGP